MLVSAAEIAAHHPRGESAVFCGDRGAAIAAMTEAFERFVKRAGRSRRAAGSRRLGRHGHDYAGHAGPADRRTQSHGFDDGFGQCGGVRRCFRYHDGLLRHRRSRPESDFASCAGQRRTCARRHDAAHAPATGSRAPGARAHHVRGDDSLRATDGRGCFAARFDCLVFHATGTGGQSMEKLLDDGHIAACSTSPPPKSATTFSAACSPVPMTALARWPAARAPYVGSCGALDMVNFGAPETVPQHYRGRKLYPHNPQITLMRTTVEENIRQGRWIAERLNQCEGEVRFLLPMGGVSALDAPGQPFWDPAADGALFDTLAARTPPDPPEEAVAFALPHQRSAVCAGGGGRVLEDCQSMTVAD